MITFHCQLLFLPTTKLRVWVSRCAQILDYLSNEYVPESELIVVDDGSTDDTAEVARENLADSRNECALRSSATSPIWAKDARSGLGCWPRAVTSHCFPMPIFRRRLPKPRNWSNRSCAANAISLWLAGAGPKSDRRSSTLAARTGRPRFQPRRASGDGLPFWDTQCGFKAFRMSVCRPIIEGATIDRFGFDVELLYLAHRAGLRLKEIPVRWDHDEGSKSTWRATV